MSAASTASIRFCDHCTQSPRRSPNNSHQMPLSSFNDDPGNRETLAELHLPSPALSRRPSMVELDAVIEAASKQGKLKGRPPSPYPHRKSPKWAAQSSPSSGSSYDAELTKGERIKAWVQGKTKALGKSTPSGSPRDI